VEGEEVEADDADSAVLFSDPPSVMLASIGFLLLLLPCFAESDKKTKGASG
jgi:hypothetical protein